MLAVVALSFIALIRYSMRPIRAGTQQPLVYTALGLSILRAILRSGCRALR